MPADLTRLETERLILRGLTLADKHSVYQNFSDREVTRYLMEPFTSLEQAENIIKAFLEEHEQGTGSTWAITLGNDGTFLGTCGYERKPGSRWEIGFDLARAYWGKGYMREALQTIIAYGFGNLDLNKIEAHTLLLNSRTIHLLKRLDFQIDGVLRESSWCNGKFMDEVFFSFRREDWERR